MGTKFVRIRGRIVPIKDKKSNSGSYVRTAGAAGLVVGLQARVVQAKAMFKSTSEGIKGLKLAEQAKAASIIAKQNMGPSWGLSPNYLPKKMAAREAVANSLKAGKVANTAGKVAKVSFAIGLGLLAGSAVMSAFGRKNKNGR
jgi:hypothetical protein